MIFLILRFPYHFLVSSFTLSTSSWITIRSQIYLDRQFVMINASLLPTALDLGPFPPGYLWPNFPPLLGPFTSPHRYISVAQLTFPISIFIRSDICHSPSPACSFSNTPPYHPAANISPRHQTRHTLRIDWIDSPVLLEPTDIKWSIILRRSFPIASSN